MAKNFDVKIFLIERNDISAIRAGSKLYIKFGNISKKDISFIFSNYLLNKKDFICSNFIFGFLMRSYSFSKYKKEYVNWNLFRFLLKGGMFVKKIITYFFCEAN